MALSSATGYASVRSPFSARTVHRRALLRPVGEDGSAAITHSIFTGPARITHVAINYTSQPATIDTIVYADNSSGKTLLTLGDATDIARSPVGTPGAMDEAGGATAATDGVDGGWFVEQGIYIDIAQADGQTTGDETVDIEIWFEPLDLVKVSLHALGSDNSAQVTRRIDMHRAGRILGMTLNYGSGADSNGDIVIKADVLAEDNSGGVTLFTRDDSATDVVSVGVGQPGEDEGGAAVAATDAVGGGFAFRTNLYFDYHDADLYATNEELLITLWVA